MVVADRPRYAGARLPPTAAARVRAPRAAWWVAQASIGSAISAAAHGRLGPGPGAEGHPGPHVRLRGPGHPEPLGDPRGGQARADQREHVPLPGRQLPGPYVRAGDPVRLQRPRTRPSRSARPASSASSSAAAAVHRPVQPGPEQAAHLLPDHHAAPDAPRRRPARCRRRPRRRPSPRPARPRPGRARRPAASARPGRPRCPARAQRPVSSASRAGRSRPGSASAASRAPAGSPASQAVSALTQRTRRSARSGPARSQQRPRGRQPAGVRLGQRQRRDEQRRASGRVVRSTSAPAERTTSSRPRRRAARPTAARPGTELRAVRPVAAAAAASSAAMSPASATRIRSRSPATSAAPASRSATGSPAAAAAPSRPARPRPSPPCPPPAAPWRARRAGPAGLRAGRGQREVGERAGDLGIGVHRGPDGGDRVRGDHRRRHRPEWPSTARSSASASRDRPRSTSAPARSDAAATRAAPRRR